MTGFRTNQKRGAAALADIQTKNERQRSQLQRLAKIEFQNMLFELTTGDVGGGKLTTPARAAATVPDRAQGRIPGFAQGPQMPRQPLNVPLGRIAWAEAPGALPVIGIFCPAETKGTLADNLLNLLSEHHRKPFSRLLFICESLLLLPFLGRYGFAYHHLNGVGTNLVFTMLRQRYDLQQVRHLEDGMLIWDDLGPLESADS